MYELLLAKKRGPAIREQRRCWRNVTVRSNDSNGKTLLAHALYNFDWSILASIDDIDLKVHYFNQCIMTFLDVFLPTRVVRRRITDKPWVTEEFCCLIRRRQAAWKCGHTAEYHRLRNKINRTSKQLRERYYNRQVQHLKSSTSAEWWRLTKRLTGQSRNSDLSNLIDTVAGGDTELLANMINESLLNVSRDLTPLPLQPAVHERTSAVPAFVIQPYEVFRQLSKISVHKSAGPDNVPNWYLRDFAFALSEPICHIFNCTLQLGKVPLLWKAANVVPIPKSGAPKSIETDLRPISLTPTLSKILEAFVGRWVLPALSKHFDRRQYGAIKGRSTTHALIDVVNTWHQAIDKRQSTRTLFIDYSKAFDHVDHATVLGKLSALGVDPALTAWLHSFLLHRQQRVKIGGCFSQWSSSLMTSPW